MPIKASLYGIPLAHGDFHLSNTVDDSGAIIGLFDLDHASTVALSQIFSYLSALRLDFGMKAVWERMQFVHDSITISKIYLTKGGLADTVTSLYTCA